VEIPIPSRLGVVDLRDLKVTILSDDPWAYGPRPLDSGDVAYLRLLDDGGYEVLSQREDGLTTIGEVGFIHGGVDISSDGAVVYSDGAVTWIVDGPGEKARTLTSGTSPRFSPDGRSIIVYDASAEMSVLVGRDGAVLGTADSAFVRPAMAN
jgi:hypothetical protein